jgi:hypothetical protein
MLHKYYIILFQVARDNRYYRHGYNNNIKADMKAVFFRGLIFVLPDLSLFYEVPIIVCV